MADIWRGTVGADPEVFVFAGRKLLPAYEFLPSKIDPKKPLIYWDGFQAEWKYANGIRCLTIFCRDTQNAMYNLLKEAKKYNASARLSLENTISIPKALLEKAPAQCVALGCEPSFNAYELQVAPIEDPRKLKYRVAGGHMHFGGWGRKPNYKKYIKALDAILGVWAVGAAQNIDIPLRRKYYGMAGEYRTPQYASSYGIEYRTLSNFWLCHPRIMQISFEIARGALMMGALKDNLWVATEEEVVDTINNCDIKQAQIILSRNKAVFDTMLLTTAPSFTSLKRKDAYQVGIKGVENEVNIRSIEKNWQLDKEHMWAYADTRTWAME